MPRGGPKRTEPALVHISHSPGRPRKAAVGQTPPRKVPARFVVGRRFALTPAWGRHCGSVWPGKLASAGGGQRRAPGQSSGQGGKRRSAAAASQRPLSRGGGILPPPGSAESFPQLPLSSERPGLPAAAGPSCAAERRDGAERGQDGAPPGGPAAALARGAAAAGGGGSSPGGAFLPRSLRLVLRAGQIWECSTELG